MVRHQTKTYRAKPTCEPAVAVKCPKCAASSTVFRIQYHTSTLAGSRVMRFAASAAEVQLVGLLTPSTTSYTSPYLIRRSIWLHR